jgi:hypothetical protein
MSPRQARRECREAERKARKAEIKRMKAAQRMAPAEAPFRNRDREGAVLAAPPAEFSESKPAGFVSTPNLSARTRREINRANAQHSTGPRSMAGKLASSRNSLRHGLASGTIIIPGEDPVEFERLTAALLDEHQPSGDTEALLVHEMAQSWWLAQRAVRLQNECFSDGGIDEKRLSLLLRYQTTHERAFHKALNTLIKLKRSRERQGAVPAKPPRNVLRPTSGFVSQTNVSPATGIGFVSQSPTRPAPESAVEETARSEMEPAA